MFKQTALILFLILASSVPAFAVDWCEHPSTQLCLTGEEGVTTIDDKSQNSSTITKNGNATQSSAQAQFGTYSYIFDGDVDHFIVDDSSGNLNFEGGTEDFSWCSWIRPDAINQTAYLSYIGDANDDFWRVVMLDTESIWLSIDAIDVKTDTGIYSANTWTHVCGVIDRSGNGQMYIDGSTSGSAVSIGGEAMNLTSTDFAIGASDLPALEYDGYTDEMIVLGAKITSTDINDMMDNGLDNPTSTDWCADANIVACYLFDDGSGTTLTDETGDNSCSLQNTPTWGSISGTNAPSYATYQLDFDDGSSEYANCGNDTSLNVDTITITSWMYGDTWTEDYETPLSKYENSFGDGYPSWDVRRRQDESNNLEFAVTVSGSQITGDSAGATATGEWVHYAFIYDGDKIHVFTNGVDNETDVANGTLDTTTNDFNMARSEEFSRYFDGKLTETAIFGTDLTSTDINAIMESGLDQAAAATSRRIFFIM